MNNNQVHYVSTNAIDAAKAESAKYISSRFFVYQVGPAIFEIRPAPIRGYPEDRGGVLVAVFANGNSTVA